MEPVSTVPDRMSHQTSQTHPCTPEKRFSFPDAVCSWHGFCLHSVGLGTWIIAWVQHTVPPEGMAFRSCHPSPDLQSVSDPSCHLSSGCCPQLPSSALPHMDSPEQRWFRLRSSRLQGRTSNVRLALNPWQSASCCFLQRFELPSPSHFETLHGSFQMKMLLCWVLFLWYQSLLHSVFHCQHRILLSACHHWWKWAYRSYRTYLWFLTHATSKP